MEVNYFVIIAAAISTLLAGFIWYYPNFSEVSVCANRA